MIKSVTKLRISTVVKWSFSGNVKILHFKVCLAKQQSPLNLQIKLKCIVLVKTPPGLLSALDHPIFSRQSLPCRKHLKLNDKA